MAEARKGLALLLGVAALSFLPALAQDNPEGPYPMVNGDIYGRNRTSTFLGDWSGGYTVAWDVNVRDPAGMAADRVQGRSEVVYDAAGNLYWLTSTGGATGGFQYVCSVTPSGTLRWKTAQSFNGAVNILGQGGVVIGANAAYVFAGGAAFDYDGDSFPGWAVAALNKATGATIWLTDLDGHWGGAPQTVSVTGNVHPILYNGRLYILTFGTVGLAVTQVDAATGAVLRYDIVDPTPPAGTYTGTASLAPGIFQNGDHGLFVNEGVQTANGIVWGIRINPTTGAATLAWTAPSSNVGSRSHPIVNPVLKQVYVHVWWDRDVNGDGVPDGFLVYSAETGAILSSIKSASFGFYDVGALGWDNASFVGGGFNGVFVKYPVDPNGIIQNSQIAFWTGETWYGESGWFGQLTKENAADTAGILITGTHDNSATDPNHASRVVAVDLARAQIPLTDDGPAYIDNIQIYAGTSLPDALAHPAIVNENFETGFPTVPGRVDQKAGWTDISRPQGGAAMVVNDPTGGGHGHVMKLDPFGNEYLASQSQGARVALPSPAPNLGAGQTFALVRWQQYRVDEYDNVQTGRDAIDPNTNFLFCFDGAFEWDGAGSPASQGTFTTGFGGNEFQAFTPGAWHQFELQYDFSGGTTIDLYIDNVLAPGLPDGLQDANNPFNTYAFTMDPTPPVANTGIGTLAPIFEYVLPGGNDVRGVSLGPDRKIYLFRSDGHLIALRSTAPPACPGDANCDGTINFGDINPFVAALTNPANCCNFANCDVNGDGSINFADINPFVAKLSPGGPCP